MPILLFLLVIEPVDVISLNKEFNNIEIYNNKIYFAPLIGKSIFVLDASKQLIPITFTDDINYRIYDFYVTPFAIYFNNGRSIEKFYFTSGVKEIVYSSKDIHSFIILPSEEIIFFDRQNRELVFLDFTNNIKFKIVDINIVDMCFYNKTIYLLTKNNLLVCDEYGNTINKQKIPESLSRVYVDSTDVILFSPNKKHLYKSNEDWQKSEFPHSLRDISSNNEYIITLEKNGTTLYFYSKSHF